jgi:hypothetical protein
MTAAAAPQPNPQAAPLGASYASIARLPDWSGAWILPGSEFGPGERYEHDPKNPRAPALKPRYLAILLAFNTRQMTGKYPVNAKPAGSNPEKCLPLGMPGGMRPPLAYEFLFTPERVTILTEEGLIRRIYTDGRPYSADPDPTYAGEAIGHWEGATLVVDTTAITQKAQFMPGVSTSGHAHVVERIHLTDREHLRIDTIVEDPSALLKPWQYHRTYEDHDAVFIENICLDNNREMNSDEPDLTPPH